MLANSDPLLQMHELDNFDGKKIGLLGSLSYPSVFYDGNVHKDFYYFSSIHFGTYF